MSTKSDAIVIPSPTTVPANGARDGVHCRRIAVNDAEAIAKLEAAVYPPHLRAGERQLRLDMEDAEWKYSNFGFGLFDDSELVGVMLVYYENDCRNLFSYFDLPCPSEISAEECLYIADFVVKQEYRHYTLRLVKQVCANLGPYEELPLYGFSTRETFEQWLKRRKAARRAGLRYVGKRSFTVPDAPYEIFLVRFEALRHLQEPQRDILTVKPITTQKGWNALEADWNALLEKTPGGTVFQSYELQQIWWRHLKKSEGRLLLLAAYQGAELRAIAPLWIHTTLYMGIPRRLVKFIGEHSEVDRPTILCNGDDRRAVEAILRYLFEHRELWDSMLFYEQPKAGMIISAAAELARQYPLLIGIVPGPPCPWVDLRGPWEEFLRTKSRNFKKNLQRKLKRLEQQGDVSFVTYETWPELLQGFETYLKVEAKSWKPQKKLGVAKNKKYLAYHNALLYEFGPRRKFHIRALFVDDKPIAATFGLMMDGRFFSLHIAHDREYADFSPGALLTAYELEEGYSRMDYLEYEFLGGFLENKVSWTSNIRETQHLYVYRRDALFHVHYAWHFHIEPAIKRLSKRIGIHKSLVRWRDMLQRKFLGDQMMQDD